MKFLVWLLRILLFFVLLGFAVKNSGIITLHFFFGSSWHFPLVAVLLLFFAAGALAGVTAALGTYLMQRRELTRLRRQLDAHAKLQ